MSTPDRPAAFPAWLASALKATALVAGLFGLVMASLVLVTALRLESADPLGSAGLKSLKERVAADGADEALYRDIRSFDLLARTAYFTGQQQIVAGTVIFILAWGLSLVCLHLANRASRLAPPAPARRSAAETLAFERRLRRGIAIAGGALALACGLSLFLVPAAAWEPEGRALASGAAAPAAGALDPAAFDQAWQGQWGVFRGPRAGVAVDPADPAAASLDPAWSVGGPALVWELPLSERGLGSPVVWDQWLFLNAASLERQLVQAFDTGSGRLLWTSDLASLLPAVAGVPEISPSSSLATPTMCCDASREYVLFPTGRLACLDREGKLLWSKELGLPENGYGIASSLALYRERLIVQFDQTEKSVLAAYDSASGRRLWETVRDSEASWSSPLVIPTPAGPRIIVAGNPNLAAFKPDDGSLAWQFPILGGEVAPSPAWHGETVYVANQYALAAAVPLAEAEAGSPKALWEHYDDLPDISSPVATARALYFCSSPGKVSCLDAVKGSLLWQFDLKETINASPLLLGKILVVASAAGSLIALDAERGGPPLWRLKLPGAILATPAWHDGRLYLRSDRALMAIGLRP